MTYTEARDKLSQAQSLADEVAEKLTDRQAGSLAAHAAVNCNDAIARLDQLVFKGGTTQVEKGESV